MKSQMRHQKLWVATSVALILALVISFVPAQLQTVFAVSPNIVISQVYGGGGNSGATLKNDFIELFNLGATPVDITGWSVQYTSSSGTTWAATNLSGTIPPGKYYLVQEAAGNGGTADLPTPDAAGTLALSANNGKVALVNSTTLLSGSCPSGLVDLVGFGTANCSEGGAAAPGLVNITADLRNNGGCIDTDNNRADFTAATPAPRNSASPFHDCSATTNPLGVGVATPSLLFVGDSTLLTVTVTPGYNPTSSGLAVTCDLSSIAGSATQTFYDDATHGDAVAGNNVFSFATSVITGTAKGVYSFACTIGDAQARSGSTTIGIIVAPLTIGTVNGPILDTDNATAHNAALNGQTVAIQGVVYEISWQPNKSAPFAYYGFFVQSTSATADGDPNTSDGIYVFTNASITVPLTGSTTPYTPKVGDEIILKGTVSEYYNMTELSPTTVVQVVRTGVDINSEVVPFVAAPPANLADANRYWERRQGMRAQVPQNSVVISGRNVFSPPDGEVWVAAPDSTIAQRSDPYQRRAFRDAHPLDDNYSATTWDGNGYRILMGSWGIKAATADTAGLIAPARTFDVVTNAPSGGVNYTFSKYRIEITTQPTLNDGVDPAANNPPATFDRKSGYSIVDYNLENLYDYRDNPFSGCDFADIPAGSNPKCSKTGTPFLSDITPPYDYVPASDAVYQARLTDIATQIIDDLHSPDILMLQEVENQDFCSIVAGAMSCGATDNADGRPDVLQDLALKIAALGGPAYDSAFDRDSSDLRGILPAYMYRTDRVQLLPASASDPVLGSSPTTNFTYPFGAPVPNNSQVSNPKTLNAVLPAGVSACETSWVFPRAASVALFRIFQSTVGDETYADVYTVNNHFKSGPDSCVAHRTEQARYNAAIVTSIEVAKPDANIVVAGDLNVYPRPDDPFAPMGQTGNSDQLGSLYSAGLGLKSLWEVILADAPASAYSYGYIGMAQTLDQMFVNQPLLANLAQYRIAHINSDFPADNPGDGARGTSDHDPNVAIFGFGPVAASATAANVVARTTAFNRVDVTWQSTREATISGFNVYRSLVGDDGNKVKLNDALIAVKVPGSPLGSAYAFTYMTTLVGVDYNYWIEVVYSNATTAMVGPVLDPATYISFIPVIEVAAP